MNTTRTTIPAARSVGLVVSRGKPLRPAAAVRAALETLIDWARHEESAAVVPMTRVQEASTAREYALKYAKTDPRFAADLCAAADRHEMGEKA